MVTDYPNLTIQTGKRKSELLPCPFCGGEPHLDRHDIFCDCGAMIEIPLYVSGKASVGGYPTYEEAKQEMIDLWNNVRTPKERGGEK